jgi:pimeloyl-ACP methyl ester carboxylesterase
MGMGRAAASSLVGVFAVASSFLAACGPAEQVEFGASPTPTPPVGAAGVTGAPTPIATPPPSSSSPLPPAVAATPAWTARFEPASCWFPPREREAECGYLVVPEDRDDPEGRDIRLAVAVFESDSPSPASDPVVYLAGGPGEHALELLTTVYDEQAFDAVFAPFLKDRDLVLFDQRGAGWSEPALECPEIPAMASRLLTEDLTSAEEQARTVEAALACRDRLIEEEGVDLSAYTSADSAADIADLRRALGYEEWNLYGVSYGTRLALTVLRDHPDGVRSVALDSPYPLEVDYYSEALPNFERALSSFLGATEPSPEMEWLLSNLALDLDDLGVDVVSIVLGGSLLQMETLSLGMHLSVQCAEEAPFSSPEAITAVAQKQPWLRLLVQRGLPIAEGLFTVCASWGAETPAAEENQPVRSDIPALVLTGGLDMITPPAWGEVVVQNLANGHLVEFPAAGHGALFYSDCAGEMIGEFLEAPEAAPDTSCVADR